MKFLILALALVCLVAWGCAGSPFAPAPTRFHVDPALQAVMDYIDADTAGQSALGMSWGQWVRRHTAAIVLSDAIPSGTTAWAIRKDRRIEISTWVYLGDVLGLAGVVVHEAKHLAGADHNCPNQLNDRDHSGAWAVGATFLEQHGRQWLADEMRRARIGCHSG